MLANTSADTTHRFQPFQPSSELFEKVDQANQPKVVFSQYNTKSHEKTQPTKPTKNGCSQ